MGGINSLSGLNKVNVDFRPTVNLGGQNKVGSVGNYRVVDCPSYLQARLSRQDVQVT